MTRTKLEIVQEILYETYGGIQTNEASISENFVVRKLNNKIAEAALKSGSAAYAIDGCFCADDIFTLTFSNLPLTVDTVTGYKTTPLPAQPIGLPSKRAVNFFPPVQRGSSMSSIFKPIMRMDIAKVRDLPGLKKVFHYTENGNEYFIDNFQIMATFTSLNASITSAGANDLSAFLNLPDDMISAIKSVIVSELRQMLGITDVTPLPPSDTPKPRQGS